MSTKPTIEKITLTTINQQYSYELPANVIRYQIQIRTTNANLRLAFASDQVDDVSAGEYWSMAQGTVFSEDELATNKGLTLYLAADTTGSIVELIYWTGIVRTS